MAGSKAWQSTALATWPWTRTRCSPSLPKWCKPSEDPKFDTYGRETIGGIVALDGKSVANLLVRTLDKAILDEIDTAPYSDEESEESAPTTGPAPEATSGDPARPS